MEEPSLKKAHIQGYEDSQGKKSCDENPYNDPLLAACWLVGWIRGLKDAAAKRAYIRGYQDSQSNKPYEENPYSNDPLLAACWAVGWIRKDREGKET